MMRRFEEFWSEEIPGEVTCYHVQLRKWADDEAFRGVLVRGDSR